MSFIGDYYLRTPELPPFKETHFREYWTASNGVFVRAQRPGLSAIIPVARKSIPIDGLFPILPQVTLEYPPMSRTMVDELLNESFAARDEQTCQLKEVLFYLRWVDGAWQWSKPEQEQCLARVTPVQSYEVDLPAPIADLHSHNTMEAFFSDTDSADDYGLRLNAVWGKLDTWPVLLVRVGVYGHFYPLEARRLFDLPSFVRDGYFGAIKEEIIREAGWLL